MNAEPTHREAIAALNGLELGSLKERADFPALIRLAGHAGLLLVGGAVILTTQSSVVWCLATLVYGIALMFLFSLEHETIHGTAFLTPWLNTAVAEISGFPLLLPPRYFRYFHFAHHRHTQDPLHDPELAFPRPQDWLGYAKYLSGIPYWRDAVLGLIRHASGNANETFIPGNGRIRVIAEARIYLLIIIALAAASIAWRSTWPFQLWVIPGLIGQPFLRAYLLAEHAACPLVADMLSNSRTTYTSALVRFLAWNMPYHSAHHAMPSVPFHRLPELNGKLRDRLRSTAEGYLDAHRQIRKGFAGRR